MAQFWWDPSMGDPGFVDLPFGYTAVLGEDVDGEPCLEFETTTNGATLYHGWPGAADSTAVDLFWEGRTSSSANWRYTGVLIKRITGSNNAYYAYNDRTDFIIGRAISQNSTTDLESTPGDGLVARSRNRCGYNNGVVTGRQWAPGDPEPGVQLEATDTTYPDAGAPGIYCRLSSGSMRFWLYAFGWGTDGDPAPTGPLGTTEAFALRHNPRLNKVIPVLSSPTVTDIGANCVRPRVTKGY